MAIFGQGAPGVRIKLRDASAINLVTNPNITAGVVGYSSKGELNKIIDLTSTSEQDTQLGSGYNNPKFNQGLYAARSILTAGGFIEYIRPYGEDIIEDKNDADYNTNQELKTDTFVVEYDYSDDATESFDINHLASTRYISDGFAGKGSRKIHTITDAILEHTNTDFELDSGTEDDASGGTDKIPLFAIMNSDPTASNRAGDRFVISSITASGGNVTVIVSSSHGFTTGDTVNITGAGVFNESNVTVLATSLTTTKFTYTPTDDITDTVYEGAVFKNEDTTSSGVDFINITTVATGKASKKYDYLEIVGGDDVILPSSIITFTDTDVDISGDTITIGDNTGNQLLANGDVITFTGSDLPDGLESDTQYTVNAVTVTGTDDTITLLDEDSASVVLTDIGSGTNTLTQVQSFSVVDSSNDESIFEFVDVYAGASVTDSDNISIDVVNDTFTADTDGAFTVTDSSKFSVGDSVTLTDLSESSNGISSGIDYLVISIDSSELTLVVNDGVSGGNASVVITTETTGVMVNQTAILENIKYGLVDVGYSIGSNAETFFDGSTIYSNLIQLSSGDASGFTANDLVILSNVETGIDGTGTMILPTGLTAGTIYQINTVDTDNDTIGLKTTAGVIVPITGTSDATFSILNLTEGRVSASFSDGYRNLRLNIIGTFGLNVPDDTQDEATSFIDTNSLDALSTPGDMDLSTSDEKTIESTTDGIVIDDTIGRTFLSLGLAIEDYQDTDFSGDQNRVFTLTSTGEAVARIFLFVEYLFAGETYTFSGTITPYVFGDLNLDITEQADNVASGWEFLVNENIALETATLDNKFDLSQSVSDGNIVSDFAQVAFNVDDPAIIYDAIWEYDPRNNNGSVMLSHAWELFLDKDTANADMLVAAGTAISNLFTKNLETINYTVMDTMLGICEKRKDLFVIFDGVDEAKVNTALKKMVGIGSQGDLARWGALFDGRSIFYDTVYTKLNVEAVKSIEVATIITLNRAANIYWLPPAGYETGTIPASLAKKQKYARSYNYAGDATSDIARLYDANINPTRVNDQGQFIYGQKTMLKRTTALNRLNVIMLVAGIHKRFANFLDRKVFQLNTPSLRSGITSELQAQLELIKSANPAGLTEGVVICDGTNNDADIIDSNQLVVDIYIQPTRTAEYITLRTTVQRTGDTSTITSAQLIGG